MLSRTLEVPTPLETHRCFLHRCAQKHPETIRRFNSCTRVTTVCCLDCPGRKGRHPLIVGEVQWSSIRSVPVEARCFSCSGGVCTCEDTVPGIQMFWFHSACLMFDRDHWMVGHAPGYLHFPSEKNLPAWRALEQLQQEGREWEVNWGGRTMRKEDQGMGFPNLCWWRVSHP